MSSSTQPYPDRPAGSGRARSSASDLILHLHPPRVPAAALRFTYTWGLGGASATLALLLALTGVLLMFRYEATVERAYLSIQLLESQVAFGSLVRAVHHWSANLLVITTFLHLVRVFLTGGYKRGRAANWMAGVALLVLVLAFNFTGYLLPWDQLAYWAITVSTSLISYLPVIGEPLSRIVLAGPQVGQGALSNFYGLHVAVLPVLTAAILSYHFWKVRKDGGISQPDQPAEPPAEGADALHGFVQRLFGGELWPEDLRSERVDTIPHLTQREFALAAIVIAGVVLGAMLAPAPLGELADASHSPNPAKAAWYFVGLQELLLHMHPLAAIALVAVVVLGLAVVPFLDRHCADIGHYFRSKVGLRASILGAVLGLYLVPLLVVVDEYWLDLPALLPGPMLLTGGLVPLLLTLAGLAAIYGLLRRAFKANRSEALAGLFAFMVVSLVMLTLVGNLFRGPNMALVLPL